MNLIIRQFDERYLSLIDTFSCVESKEELDFTERELSGLTYTNIPALKNIIQPSQRPFDSPISMRISIDDFLSKFK